MRADDDAFLDEIARRAWLRAHERTLMAGREVKLVVRHADRSSTTFAVSIDFDGDLSD